MADTDMYVGAVVLTINGVDYDVTSFTDNTKTGRTVVKTMNRKGRSLGTARGIADYSLTVGVAIPKTGEPDWVKELVNAKITIEPLDGDGQRETWTGVFLQELGGKYGPESEASREMTLVALDHYRE